MEKNANVNKIVVLSSFGMLLDGYQLTVIAFAVLLIPNYIHLSDYSLDYGLLIASVIIGAIIGTIIVGYLSDLIGRRRVYLSTLLFFILFDMISAFSVNFYMLFISRVLLGIVLGAEYPVANSYIAEVTPSEKRGFYLAMATVFFSIGSISSAIVAVFMFPFGNIGWRLMLGVAVIPAIVVEFFRFSLPESKMWEIKKEKKGFLEMFSKKYYKDILLAAIIWFLYDIVAYGLSLTLPTILKLGHFVTNVDNALLTTFFLVIGIVSGIFVMMRVDKYGRKGIQITGFLVMGILFLILPHFYFLTGIIVIVSFLELFNAFDGATVGIIPAEVTITKFRGTSYGFSSMMGKIGAVIGVIAMSLLIHGKNYFNAYIFLASVMGIAIILTLFLPETKNIKLE
ncbi:MFS transporter [Ferroplasma sp.]|uniref:MFS transporter n=1 Tax=Ferroplasma sp. TaxID=2591003 RepID=UPI00307E89B5